MPRPRNTPTRRSFPSATARRRADHRPARRLLRRPPRLLPLKTGEGMKRATPSPSFLPRSYGGGGLQGRRGKASVEVFQISDLKCPEPSVLLSPSQPPPYDGGGEGI